MFDDVFVLFGYVSARAKQVSKKFGDEKMPNSKLHLVCLYVNLLI